MRKALLMLGLMLCATLAQAQPVPPMPRWVRFYMPIRPQLVPGGGGFGSSGSSGTANPALNTVQTPDTYYFSTDPLGNSLIIGEAADSGFDFAHAAATDPTLFIHSHNQSTTQFFGVNHDGNDVHLNNGQSARYFFFDFAGTTRAYIADGTGSGSGLGLVAGAFLGFISGASGNGVQDTFLSRDAAAALQMGADNNGATVDEVFKGPDGITGTDLIGGALTLEAGRGTGAGVSHPLTLNRQVTKATGTTAQTYAPAVIICPTKILSNTSGTVQTIATITTTTTTAGGLEWVYTVTASNGTVLDSDAGDMNVAWNNNAGTVAVAVSASLGDVQSNGSGTLTAAQTATAATNVISLKYTPAWTVITPTTVTGYATFTINSSGDTIVCQ